MRNATFPGSFCSAITFLIYLAAFSVNCSDMARTPCCVVLLLKLKVSWQFHPAAAESEPTGGPWLSPCTGTFRNAGGFVHRRYR